MNGSTPEIAVDAGGVARRAGRTAAGRRRSRARRARSTCPLLVPPDQRLALAPRLAVGVGRGAVVQDPPVGRPGPAPLRRDPALLGSRLAPRGLVHAVGADAAVDPAAAGRGAVGLELGVGGQRLAVGVPAVDLGQHGVGGRLGQRPLDRVVPGEVQYRPVHLVGGGGQLLPDPAAEVVGEPQVAAGVPGRLDRLVVPLQHPLGVGEGAVLLGVRGGGQEEHLGADVLRAHLPGLDLRAVLPEGGALDHDQVPDHQPVQAGQAEPLHPAVGRADRRVLAEQEVALAVAGDLGGDGLVGAVAAGQPGQVVVAEVVLRGRRVAPPGLEQADHVGARVRPRTLVHALGVPRRRRGPRSRARAASAGSRAAGRTGWGCRWSPGWRRARAAPGCRRRAGRCCRAATAGWRRCGCTARPRVLGPADAVHERGRPVGARVLRQGLADLGEDLRRHAADLLRPSPACTGRSAASAPGTRTAGAAASRRGPGPGGPRRRRRRAPRRAPPAAPAGARARGSPRALRGGLGLPAAADTSPPW